MRVLKFLTLCLLFYACSNDDSTVNEETSETPDTPEISEMLLRSVKSDHRTKLYYYNSDSILTSIKEEINEELRSESEIVYNNGKVSEIIWNDLLENVQVKRVFEYEEDLLVKETMIKEDEVIALDEYQYDEENQLIKHIEKIEWNDVLNRQTRVIDIQKISGQNEIHVKYNDVLSYKIIYDNNLSPFSKMEGYGKVYSAQLYGITNNILSMERVYVNGESDTQTSNLTIDDSGEYLLEVIKRDEDQQLIAKEIYTYN
ncbi:hypothetical protein [Aureivirga sp. CE67]|uniref:hypothetical protein n=1 Tax=Aureivirga sp. CE67 TaxID=1788983 RepID=UPI0018CBB860|nr:hypothetical protein [Aureivirga sp. CE67]